MKGNKNQNKLFNHGFVLFKIKSNHGEIIFF